MRLPFRQSRLALLPAVLLAVACSDRRNHGDATIAVTPQPVPAVVGGSVPEEPASAVSGATHPLLVVNPMPHDMIVTMVREPNPLDIGRVPAGGRQIFDVPVPGGSTVTLIARDEAKTHSPSTTITLAAEDVYSVWTIE